MVPFAGLVHWTGAHRLWHVLVSATPERTDRLFPGDADQFSHPDGSLNIANGAAGVLWALHFAGVAVPEQHVDWPAGAARRLDAARPRLYDGLAGKSPVSCTT
ncbi:hypothetical protein [Streptomyces sp. S.PB5]|uniref:hypothetical protein n=1 Tax=Streptomyces sp. S.PB5 TaxID=3020844 RepID=UPI0025B056BE|nr:hypothetical protein [Streptomyces sp. S.PB5]MDN3026376.1 hypothetical protein [Streptomyces sp. S.PB5]